MTSKVITAFIRSLPPLSCKMEGRKSKSKRKK